MNIIALEQQLSKYRPFNSALYTQAVSENPEIKLPLPNKIKFYVNDHGHNLDRIQIDDENDHKIATIATINKRQPYNFVINDEFWLYIPNDKQKGLYMTIAQFAATPIKDRGEFNDQKAQQLDQQRKNDLKQKRNEKLNDLLANFKPETTSDITVNIPNSIIPDLQKIAKNNNTTIAGILQQVAKHMSDNNVIEIDYNEWLDEARDEYDANRH